MLYVDHPTSLVISGCLCVVAASSVILVILRVYKTMPACRNSYARLPRTVERSCTAVWNCSADSGSSTPLTKAATGQHHPADGDDVDDHGRAMLPPRLAADSRQRSETGPEE